MENPERRQERERGFNPLPGFEDVSHLRTLFGEEVSTVAEYRANQLTAPESGTWAQNNGVIAMVTSDEKIHVWIPKMDGSSSRGISYEKAINSLRAAGYSEANFYVPYSNKRYENG
jgi:uncharacterized GH25 family protein